MTEDREVIGQRRLRTQQPAEVAAADGRADVLRGHYRGDEDHDVSDDQADRDVALRAGARRAESRTNGTLRTSSLGHALRALMADRRGPHAVGADRSVTSRAPDIGLPRRMPVANWRAHRRRRDLSHARKGSS